LAKLRDEGFDTKEIQELIGIGAINIENDYCTCIMNYQHINYDINQHYAYDRAATLEFRR
jgi:hypothetical protein